jgi:hypothetical protein
MANPEKQLQALLEAVFFSLSLSGACPSAEG